MFLPRLHTVLAGFLLAVPILAATSAQAASILVNGSFEDGNFTPVVDGAYVNVDSASGTLMTGWTVSGTGNWTNDTTLGFAPAKEGHRVFDLSYAGHCYNPATGVLSQDMTTSVGQRYRLVFHAAAPGATDPCSNPKSGTSLTPRALTVKVGADAFPFAITPSGQRDLTWQRFEIVFEAKATTTTLSFEGTNKDIGYWGVVLDDLSVNATSDPASIPPAASQQLLRNGSFDAGANGPTFLEPNIYDWDRVQSIWWVGTESVAQLQDGPKAVNLSTGLCNQTKSGYLYQGFTTTPGQRYRLIVYAAAPYHSTYSCGAASSTRSLSVAVANSKGTPTGGVFIPVQTSPSTAVAWYKKELIFEATAATTFIAFSDNIPSGAPGYYGNWGVVIDAATVTMTSAPATVAPPHY